MASKDAEMFSQNSSAADHNKAIIQHDPAILCCGPPSSTFKYTHQELTELRNTAISKQRPIFMDDPIFISRGYWKRSESPYDERTERVNRCIATGTDRQANNSQQVTNSSEIKRRSGGDPRERIRKEDSNIVLSPQRRSFNMGCQMPSIPSNSGPGLNRIDRETNRGRIGSGRILNRDVSWDYKPPDKDAPDADFNFRPNSNLIGMREHRTTNPTGQPDERDRRSYGRDDNKSPTPVFQPQNHQRSSRNMRYSNTGNGMNYDRHDNRRRYNNDRDEEPEWFSGGPTSQHDVIELRGFEDPIDDEITIEAPAKQKPPVKVKSIKDEVVEVKMDEQVVEVETTPPPTTTTTTTQSNDTNNNDSKQSVKNDPDFNFEDFLNLNSLNEIFDDEKSGPQPEAVGSRFSRWFRPDSPAKSKIGKIEQQQFENSRRSSLHDELYNMINDVSSPNIQIDAGNDSNKYFAPISPANSTNTLLEFLHRGKFPAGDNKQQPSQQSNKRSAYVDEKQQIHSVEELEAKMRQTAPNQQQRGSVNNSEHSKQQEAFKKLLAQMSDEKISKSEEIQKVGPLMFSGHQHSLRQQHQRHQGQAPIQLHPPTPPSQPIPQHSNVLKRPEASGLMQSLCLGETSPQALLQQISNPGIAQEKRELIIAVLNAFNSMTQVVSPSFLAHLLDGSIVIPPELTTTPTNHPQNRSDILKRPEAHAFMQGLSRGEISPQVLLQQMANPATGQEQRDIIRAVLNAYTAITQCFSPNCLAQMLDGTAQSVNSQNLGVGTDSIQTHLLYQHQGQNMRLSPLPNGIPQRIPSPRELQFHTQTIMQNALIKKKLEEQRENFRKRQELHQQIQHQHDGQSPTANINNINNKSPAKQYSHIPSPTPLAFTPTSVLRKMTAEKDMDLPQKDEKKILQMQQIQQQQQQQQIQLQQQQFQQRSLQSGQQPFARNTSTDFKIENLNPKMWAINQMSQPKPLGRPIVKGGGQQMQHASNIEFQQIQQYQRNNQNILANLQQVSPAQSSQNQAAANPQQLQQLMQHRQQQQQIQQQRSMRPPFPFNRTQSQTGSHSQVGDNRMMNFNREGGLSPTSNQLARWFSPELLAQASAGKLPTLNIEQALSLEEFERIQHSSTTVHN